MKVKVLYIFLTMSLICTMSRAQTCCSGGVPLSGNVGLPSGEKGMLQLSMGYDDNVLKTLKSGLEHLDDQSRTRHTRSVIVQLGYQLTDKISIDIFQSYVFQERRIQQNSMEDQTLTKGLGDMAVLLKYKWLSLGGEAEHTSISSALGVKLPTGPSDLTRENGIGINADLQPGSGAWDGVFWTQFIHHPKKRPTGSLVSTLIYNLKGTNGDYLGFFDYQFGNEFQWHFGYGDRIVLKKIFWDPSLRLQYRHAAADRQDDMPLFSTGGQWLFVRAGSSLWLSPKWALRTAATIPIFGKVVGTQLSPTYRLEIGIFTRFNLRKKRYLYKALKKEFSNRQLSSYDR